MSASVTAYSLLTNPILGTTGTGLDQFVAAIVSDPGLAGASTAEDIAAGANAANALNALLVQAINATGTGTDKVFTAAEVVQINTYIRTNLLSQWNTARGADSGAAETGIYRVVGEGASDSYRGARLVDTVINGIYHVGSTIQNGQFLGSDNKPYASTEQVAKYLTQFYTDHSTSNSGLDRLTDLMMADSGLAKNNPDAKIAAGIDAANGIVKLIVQGIAATGVGSDGSISAADVVAIQQWIRADQSRNDQFVALHGDDENGVETGFHLIQGDGGSSTMFGRNLVNTVADGMFHIGFSVNGDGTRLVNEDGDDNQTISDVADWINYFLADPSTTGTGLDRIVDEIMRDRGLARCTDADQIVEGAKAADGLNQLIADAIAATGAMTDGWITIDDLYRMNAWIRADDDRYTRFLELHGDDEGDEETGFHLVQGDGGSTRYFGEDLINTVADGMYHVGFEIENGRFLNEDGDENQTLADVSAWLNALYAGKTLVQGTERGDRINGTSGSEHILGEDGNDTVDGGGGGDLIYAGWGDDSVRGGGGTDILYGQGGRDSLDGGDGSDIYRVTGAESDGWCGFGDYDSYRDSGATGTDRIEATGPGDVDIGLSSFGPTSGIEVIDATGATGAVRVLGDWEANRLDFSATQFVGRITIDGGYGDDSIVGTSGSDTIVGGGGDDELDGGSGSDRYVVSGNEKGGWSSFGGYDTYEDSGASGTDTIAAIGDGDVDIGLTGFGAESGIEVINASGATGAVRLLGDWESNALDFTGVSIVGSVTIDAGYGNDTVIGTSDADVIVGGGGDDELDGAEGGDSYVVKGNEKGGWSKFAGFDVYADTGTTGTDTIQAIGKSNVDIGFAGFDSQSGIEVIDGTRAKGSVTLLGDWSDNVLDFSTVTLVGGNVVINGAGGNDEITGNAQANTIAGGIGDDWLDGGDGGDTYLVTGNEKGGWSSFNGYDTYADSGSTGTDTIRAVGKSKVDIGLAGFDADSGIEIIDTSGAKGVVRIVGSWESDDFDFSDVTFVGKQPLINGGGGDDTITGNGQANLIAGGDGNDELTGGAGKDIFRFDRALNTWGNVDTITDFAVPGDTIQLDDAVFRKVGKAGALNAAAFTIGSAAGDSSDRIIYDSGTGALLYDADGTGKAEAVQFAQLSTGLGLTAADFQIV